MSEKESKRLQFEDEYENLIYAMTDMEESGGQPEGVLFEFVANFIDFARRKHGSEGEKTANSYSPNITMNAINAATNSIEQSILDDEF